MEYQKLYDLYGTREEFPLIHALIDCTVSAPNILSENRKLEDDPYIAWAVYDSNSKSVRGRVVVSLTKRAVWIDTRWKVMSTNNEFVGSGNQTIYGSRYATYDIIIENVDINRFSAKEFNIELTTVWQEETQTILKSSKNITAIQLEGETLVENIDVTDPAKQPGGPDTGKIVVYYGRTPGSSEKVDYDYSAEYDGSNVIFKMAGSGFAKTKRPVINVNERETVLKIDWKKGSRKYSNNIFNFICMENGFSWHFDPNWKVTLSKEFFESSNICDYHLYIEFYCKGIEEPQHIQVSSLFENDLQPNCKKIPQLDLRLGCVAKGSLIAMRDGTKKTIQNIRMGEDVLTRDGYAKVINIYSGPEDELICICTEKGKRLLISDMHPIFTNEGIFMARDLNAGMKVLTDEDEYEEIHFLYRVENVDTVYNLELDTKEVPSVICEGIVVGDVNTPVRSRETPIVIDAELKKELEKIDEFVRRETNGRKSL